MALHNLNKKDDNSNSNAKVLIRVLKNLKSDSKESITLTGYQITSIVYSLEDYALAKPNGQILFLLLECSIFLKRLIDNPFMRRSLKSPENNAVLNKTNEESFVHGCNKLKNELDVIIKHLVLEIDLYTRIKDTNQPHLIPNNLQT
ncbi:MAG: hypothetical protein JEZ09_02915 [Salinivirgaceae bacterium]|nr:hypothetical protein [Salinivirgaceae bacterium]